MPEAVSNSSTLIHLAGIGHLGLLKEFYDRVLITPSVWREVVEEGKGRAGAEEVKECYKSGWIEVIAPGNEAMVRLLKRELHEGEAEALALAIEQHPAVILLDELEARRIANVYELCKTGVIGILIKAKLEGKIVSLRRELDILRSEAGFWISDEVYWQALRAVTEDE
ncbi:MAG: DUF3368 domain-containing protein [Chloroflexota bacterium]